MKIHFRDGLLFISLEIMYRGKKQTVENMVLDTGAARTVISPDAVAALGIGLEPGDPVIAAYGIGGRQYAFVKQVDGVRFGSFSITPCKIDFGLADPEGKIDGLLGLDLLMKAGAVIDLKNLLLLAEL